MSLSDVAIRAAKAKDKPYKLADADGLYLHVSTAGSRLWRMNYRFSGRQKTLALGQYPAVSLAKAREKRDRAKAQLAEGIDPSHQKKVEKLRSATNRRNTFGHLSREYLDRLRVQGRSEGTVNTNEWYLFTLAAPLQNRPMMEITPIEVLEVLKKIEASGRVESAHRARAAISSVFRFAISTLRADTDPTYPLRGALAPVKAVSHAAVIDPVRFGALLNTIDEYDGWFTLKAALQIMALCYPRPYELRTAEWSEINLEKAEWNIPASKTKMRRPHDIPLSKQALTILKEVAGFSKGCRLVFPSIRNVERPLSENAMNSALRRMGYGKDEHTAHGFRSSASSILNSYRFPYDVIEASLAHLDPNTIRRTYNRYSYWEERVDMAQKWADICDSLKQRKTKRDNRDLI